jgi:hypothetical protein
MFQVRRAPILIALAATLLVAACGGQNLPTAPDGTDGLDDGFDDDFTLPSPDPTASTTPDLGASPTPNPSPTPSSWAGPSNDFRRMIGKGFVSNWLYGPRGLAVAGNLLFIADANRSSLRGSYGAVMAFDGMNEDTFTTYAGMYYERRIGETTSFMLAATAQAVAINDHVVIASDASGVKGFIRAIPENALNGGAALAPPCRDMAFAGGVLYMAQSGQVAAIKEGTWDAAPGFNVDARGLGADTQGRLWIVTTDRIQAYQAGQQVLDFDARGTDGKGPGAMQLKDVAVDPRNGDVYALDQGRVLRFDSAGKYLGTFGAGRIGQGASIVVGADGSVYVSDAQDGEVYQYRPGN